MSWRKAYWPRSGERGSACTERISLRSERGRSGSSSASAVPLRAREALLREGLAEHGAVLDEPPLLGVSPSRRAATSACSVSGTSSVLDRPVGR